ncbi:MAG: hypothetical protein H0V09_00670 [Gemmatimonadetes bacterium]|nr:hypothetical protein [Gemmatimonadota bacterium]
MTWVKLPNDILLNLDRASEIRLKNEDGGWRIIASSRAGQHGVNANLSDILEREEADQAYRRLCEQLGAVSVGPPRKTPVGTEAAQARLTQIRARRKQLVAPRQELEAEVVDEGAQERPASDSRLSPKRRRGKPHTRPRRRG